MYEMNNVYFLKQVSKGHHYQHASGNILPTPNTRIYVIRFKDNTKREDSAIRRMLAKRVRNT